MASAAFLGFQVPRGLVVNLGSQELLDSQALVASQDFLEHQDSVVYQDFLGSQAFQASQAFQGYLVFQVSRDSVGYLAIRGQVSRVTQAQVFQALVALVGSRAYRVFRASQDLVESQGFLALVAFQVKVAFLASQAFQVLMA